MDSRRERRMSAQPLDKPCAGSVFRNPEEIPAWKLIEELGLRGHKLVVQWLVKSTVILL